jgi:hypothetical protein
MTTKNSHKSIMNFYCEHCDYKCSKNSDFNKHLLTAKHLRTTNDYENISTHICGNCKKQYSCRQNLYRHKLKCEKKSPKVANDKYTNNEIIMENGIQQTDTANTMLQLIKQNQEFKELIVEQNKQLIEIAQKPTTTNNTINNNQKFNLQVFLNEQCKDAINMSEFLANMTLDMEDLTETGRLGYVGGISRILVNKLQELDVYKRPLHCTDMKRETLYIRENDEWLKEKNSKQKMNELVNKVANKNCKNIRQWTDEHPEYQVFDSPENMEYVRLTQAMLGGLGEQECKQFQDKIVKSVIKEVMVNKI